MILPDESVSAVNVVRLVASIGPEMETQLKTDLQTTHKNDQPPSPKSLWPTQSTCACSLRKQVEFADIEISAITLLVISKSTGRFRSVVVPSPSWPVEKMQHQMREVERRRNRLMTILIVAPLQTTKNMWSQRTQVNEEAITGRTNNDQRHLTSERTASRFNDERAQNEMKL